MKTKNMFVITVFVIGCVFILILFFTIAKQAQQVINNNATATAIRPTPTSTALPAITIGSLPTVTLIPTITATFIPRGSKPPDTCTFPLAQTTRIESRPARYTFSQPKVVLIDDDKRPLPKELPVMGSTNTMAIDWLPDSQNIMIVRSTLVDREGYQHTIELFNPETEETRIYVKNRLDDVQHLAWDPALNAVIYRAREFLYSDDNEISDVARHLMIGYGNPDDSQMLVKDLPFSFNFVVKPDGSQIAYLMGNQLIKLDSDLKMLPPISFDSARWDYLHKNDSRYGLPRYEMAWRPNASQIFLYNVVYDNIWGYTYLLDADTGQLCDLKFDGWAVNARWSPNGRYLAIIRSQENLSNGYGTDVLSVLDTITGKLYVLEIPKELAGRHLVNKIAWAPDNRHLLMLGESNPYQSDIVENGLLFLGDFIAGKMERIFPSYPFLRSGLAWSPDGSKVLIDCSTSEAYQLCLIAVQYSK